MKTTYATHAELDQITNALWPEFHRTTEEWEQAMVECRRLVYRMRHRRLAASWDGELPFQLGLDARQSLTRRVLRSAQWIGATAWAWLSWAVFPKHRR